MGYKTNHGAQNPKRPSIRRLTEGGEIDDDEGEGKENIDPEEMSDVRWVSREEVLVALDIATKPNYSLTDETEEAGVRVPGPIAIAHHIIKAWANDE